MSIEEFKSIEREFLRAPLKSNVLYVDSEYVLRASTINISEGGIFLQNLPHLPKSAEQWMAVLIPQIPKLSSLSIRELKLLYFDELPSQVIKVNTKIVRSAESKSPIEQIFVKTMACEMLFPSMKVRKCISHYVDNYIKNLVHLLSLFESLNENNEDKVLEVKTISAILGYDSNVKISHLRAKVLHDYQSIGQF